MNSQQTQLLNAIENKNLVKAISGIANFDIDSVSQVVRAATVANATAVDVAARADIVRTAKQLSNLPVFASSVDPQELAIAVANGADVAEVGNFDMLYKDGHYLSYGDVLNITQKTLALLPQGSLISVTVPGYLPAEAQITLVKELELLNVTLIQTEGINKAIGNNPVVMTVEEKSAETFKNTKVLANATHLPVMSASGITAENAAQAILNGACGVGVGSAVNKLALEKEMVETLMALVNNINNANLLVAAA